MLQISNCQNYTVNGECVSCLPGNKLVSGFCYPTLNLENCQSQSDYGCVECSEGFYLTPSRSCVKFEAGCLKYYQGICIACHPNFYLNQNKKCTIDGCQSYNFDSCAQCQQGFTSENGKCVRNGCVKVVNNACVQCKDDLRLSAQGCIQPVNYQCTTCSAGYTFVNSACIRVIPGCTQYNSNNLCTNCQSPFQLTINGICQILGCQTYSQNGCTACISPFVLKNNTCSINNCVTYVNDGCSTCQDGYQLVNKQCFVRDVNCLEYSTGSTFACIRCAPKFYLFQGTCRPAIRGCNYDNQGKCFCKSPFELSPQNTCEIRGCNSYNW